MKLLGLSAGPAGRSACRVALGVALARVRSAYPGIRAELLDLGDHDIEFCDGRRPDLYEGDTRRAIDAVVAADALVIATPIICGAYSGILKNLVDILPADAVRGKAVGLVAIGDSDREFLAVEHVIKPLIGYLDGRAVPESVFLTARQLTGATATTNEQSAQKLEQLADAVVASSRTMPVRCFAPREFVVTARAAREPSAP